MRDGVGGVWLAALLMGGCATTDEVTAIGPRHPAREKNCAVEFFPNQPPPYPVVEVGTARVTPPVALPNGQRSDEYDHLRALACAYGADTVFAVHEIVTSDKVTVAATLAVRGGGATAAAPSP